MDQIPQQTSQQNRQGLKRSFELSFDNKSYTFFLQIIEQRIEISLILQGQSLFKWIKLLSIEQTFKLHSFFLQFTKLQDNFDIFCKLIENSIKSLESRDSKMLILFEFEQLLGKIQFTLQLDKVDINTNDAIIEFCERISNLEAKSTNQQNQIEQIIKDQSIQIQQLKDSFAQQIQQMNNAQLRQVEQLMTEHKNQMKELKNEISLMRQKMFSNILLEGEQEMIKRWIGNNQIQLQQIYRATINGFQIQNIYDCCRDKQKVVFFIQTTQNIRFGFYADCSIKNYNGYLTQNPNNFFLFSLDSKKKFTSNERNSSDAFCSCGDYLALGPGHDLALFSNSNSNNSSYTDCSGYGRKEGLTRYALNGGSKYFTSREVEIFEVLQISE
ncbi:hypothetical protein ABPG72_022321 [Tetrahymena utriculariae]